MSKLAKEFHEIVTLISENYEIPSIKGWFFPKYYPEGQPKSAEFIAFELQDGTVGLSYVLNPDINQNDYENVSLRDYSNQNPLDLALEFGSDDAARQMISLAAINAISQFAMKKINFKLDYTTDSLGLIDIQPDDVVGMVGFFMPLIGMIKRAGAKLKIIEKKEKIVKKFTQFDISLDPRNLEECNKVLSTSTTILNNSFEEILSYCKKAEKISIIGPTAGYFPDPLFKRGINVLGGTQIQETDEFFNRISKGNKWGKTSKKYCILRANYPGINELIN